MQRLNRTSKRSRSFRPSWLALSIGLSIVWVSSVQAFGGEVLEREGTSTKGRAAKSRAGLAILDFDLPFEFKARLDGFYSRSRHTIDALAYNRWLSPGPAIRRDALIESRVSIGRKVLSGVDLEVAWWTQNPLSFRSLSGPDRQTVGAFIRFTR
jgi:hypothetical protein